MANYWLPIIGAPKDGTQILVCNVNLEGGHMNVVCHVDGQHPSTWETQEGDIYHVDAFTHWMDLPAMPRKGCLGSGAD